MYNFVNETVFSNVFDMSKKIHVISFQVPYPPNYGGAIDVYYKLQSLKEEGYYIILHTYQYRHDRYENELLSIVNEVHYYIRKTNILSQFSLTPYIVNSRKDKTLLRNLQKDDAPILFEGLHTCYFLNDSSLRNRIKLVRTHNVEHEYYKQLQLSSQSFRRKLFFYIEAFRLKRFEKVLTYANIYWPSALMNKNILRRNILMYRHHYCPASLSNKFKRIYPVIKTISCTKGIFLLRRISKPLIIY